MDEPFQSANRTRDEAPDSLTVIVPRNSIEGPSPDLSAYPCRFPWSHDITFQPSITDHVDTFQFIGSGGRRIWSAPRYVDLPAEAIGGIWHKHVIDEIAAPCWTRTISSDMVAR